MGEAAGDAWAVVSIAAPAAMQFTAPEAVMLLAHWLALWLAFYLLSRRPRSAATVLAGGAYIAMACYVLSTAIRVAPEYVPHSMIWGAWIGGLVPFAPILLLHSYLHLTGVWSSHRRLWLTLLYAAAAAVYVLGLDDVLLYRYAEASPGATDQINGLTEAGPLYPLQVVQVAGTLLLAVLVLASTRNGLRASGRRVPRQLDALLIGTALLLIGTASLFVNYYFGSLALESIVQLLVLAAAAIVAVALAGYPGLLEGQLLRTDLRASLLGSALLMAAFVAVALAVGASLSVLVGLGWFVLAVFLFREDLWSLADRVFYGPATRAGRAGLRTAAVYAGSAKTFDLTALSREQSAELVEYLGSLDRAGLAAARLEGDQGTRLALLARPEFAEVREALGLPSAWTPEHGVDLETTRAEVIARLEPRERQALGLKYLGYSDKEMARLMGVKPNVPRSYLSQGKRKLGLSAGAALMLYVHVAGLVDSDALPLIAASPVAPESREASAGGGAPVPDAEGRA